MSGETHLTQIRHRSWLQTSPQHLGLPCEDILGSAAEPKRTGRGSDKGFCVKQEVAVRTTYRDAAKLGREVGYG